MRSFNKQIDTNADISAGYTSPYTPLKNIYMYSIMAIISGSPTGSIKLQASNDPETNDTQLNSTGLPPAVGPSNWADIADSTFPISASGNTMWNVREVGYNYVRVVYTGTGAANITVIVNGKGV